MSKDQVKSYSGLTHDQVVALRAQFGANEIVSDEQRFLLLKLLWHQLNNWLVYILLISALITYFTDHILDTYVILGVIFFNTIVGLVQEYRASQAINALRDLVIATAKVYRSGQLLTVPAIELVPGDLVLLEAGDRVPADGRLVSARNLRVVESSLTGESLPVDKSTDLSDLSQNQSQVYMSTVVAAGMATFTVTAIGSATLIGKIARDLKENKKEKTHFELKTELLAKQMSVVAILGTVITFIVGYFVRGFAFTEIFAFSVASLVSSVPEGLPAVIAIILATGASRMARKKAIVRSLPATETLSVVDVIATDKTGTLTQNTMTVTNIYCEGQEIRVSGSGWQTQGDLSSNGQPLELQEQSSVKDLILAATWCSRASLTPTGIQGDPTEAALLVLSYKAKLQEELAQSQVLDELPFDQELKLKAVLVEYQGQRRLAVSGTTEALLARSTLSAKEQAVILKHMQTLAGQAMRVIALAMTPVPVATQTATLADVQRLQFLGLVGMVDPLRQGVAQAVAKARQAGIRVIMQTGDHRDTALAIAREAGIVAAAKTVSPDELVLTQTELEQLNETEFAQAVQQVSVFARLTPAMKLKILRTLQSQGHAVAMTGDGVNDVLALKQADLGIAMGQIGTDAAREASDIVLADDNFASLVQAIEEGRTIFANTRQASAFLLTTNFTEDLIIILSVLLGLPLPLLASQILWLNLVTDGLTDMALAAEPGHGDLLSQKPKRKGEGILIKQMLGLMVPIIAMMTVVSLAAFWWFMPEGLDKARTAVFCAMCFTQLVNIFNMRSLDLSIWRIGWFSNKYVVGTVMLSLFLQYLAMNHPSLMTVFRFTPLSLVEVSVLLLVSLAVLAIGESYKFLKTKVALQPRSRN